MARVLHKRRRPWCRRPVEDVMRKRAVTGPFGVTLLLLLAWSSRGHAEAPAARGTRTTIFPVGVELVNVNVSVLNGRDRYVTDLAQQDFIVLENGVRQE